MERLKSRAKREKIREWSLKRNWIVASAGGQKGKTPRSDTLGVTNSKERLSACKWGGGGKKDQAVRGKSKKAEPSNTVNKKKNRSQRRN